MNATLRQYLTINQYNNICRYWKIMNKLQYEIDNFDYCYIEFEKRI